MPWADLCQPAERGTDTGDPSPQSGARTPAFRRALRGL